MVSAILMFLRVERREEATGASVESNTIVFLLSSLDSPALFAKRIGVTRRLLNFFSSGLGLLHYSHPSLTWFKLPRGSQQRQADNGNTHSIRVFDSRSLRSMKPTHAGPVRASVRPADRVRRHRRNFTILRHAIDSENSAEKPLNHA